MSHTFQTTIAVVDTLNDNRKNCCVNCYTNNEKWNIAEHKIRDTLQYEFANLRYHPLRLRLFAPLR